MCTCDNCYDLLTYACMPALVETWVEYPRPDDASGAVEVTETLEVYLCDFCRSEIVIDSIGDDAAWYAVDDLT